MRRARLGVEAKTGCLEGCRRQARLRPLGASTHPHHSARKSDHHQVQFRHLAHGGPQKLQALTFNRPEPCTMAVSSDRIVVQFHRTCRRGRKHHTGVLCHMAALKSWKENKYMFRMLSSFRLIMLVRPAQMLCPAPRACGRLSKDAFAKPDPLDLVPASAISVQDAKIFLLHMRPALWTGPPAQLVVPPAV